jgi:hypothetical protein
VTTKCGYLGSDESGKSALSANLRLTKIGSSLDIIQGRQCTCNLTLRCVHTTNVEVEDQ